MCSSAPLPEQRAGRCLSSAPDLEVCQAVKGVIHSLDQELYTQGFCKAFTPPHSTIPFLPPRSHTCHSACSFFIYCCSHFLLNKLTHFLALGLVVLKWWRASNAYSSLHHCPHHCLVPQLCFCHPQLLSGTPFPASTESFGSFESVYCSASQVQRTLNPCMVLNGSCGMLLLLVQSCEA